MMVTVEFIMQIKNYNNIYFSPLKINITIIYKKKKTKKYKTNITIIYKNK